MCPMCLLRPIVPRRFGGRAPTTCADENCRRLWHNQRSARNQQAMWDRRRALNPKPEVLCEVCGEACPQTWRGTRPRSCGEKACVAELKRRMKREWWESRRVKRTCPYCGEPVPKKRKAHCGAPNCDHEHRRAKDMRRYEAQSLERRLANPLLLCVGGCGELCPPTGGGRRVQCGRPACRSAHRKSHRYLTEGVLIAADWASVVERFQGLCAYCDEVTDPVCIEHVLPRSRGGTHTIGNVLPSCASCNSQKRDRTLWEWSQWRMLKGLPPLRTDFPRDDPRFAHLVISAPARPPGVHRCAPALAEHA